MYDNGAVVLLSGGQDSSLCLDIAKRRHNQVICLTINYNQRHTREIESAKKIAELYECEHHIIPLHLSSSLIPSSALTNSDLDISETNEVTGLPASFVPSRNIIMLSIASSIAIARRMNRVYSGVCQTDYSGYPDCRLETIRALELAVGLGNNFDDNLLGFRFITPLINLSKKEAIMLARKSDLAWKALGMSWTCYEGGERPCGQCPSCKLRQKGFDEAELVDPAL